MAYGGDGGGYESWGEFVIGVGGLILAAVFVGAIIWGVTQYVEAREEHSRICDYYQQTTSIPPPDCLP